MYYLMKTTTEGEISDVLAVHATYRQALIMQMTMHDNDDYLAHTTKILNSQQYRLWQYGKEMPKIIPQKRSFFHNGVAVGVAQNG